MKIRHKRTSPEKDFSDDLRAFMRVKGWHTEKTHGSMFMSGWPDILAFHNHHGQIWIETKAGNNKLSESQRKKFKVWSDYGAKIYVIKSLSEYMLLFREPNWIHYV